MFGWICAAASIYAAFSLGHPFVIANAVANVWTLGIMHNYPHDQGPSDNAERVAIMVNMVTSLIGGLSAAVAFFGG
jgi:hypothetical protein